MATAGVCAVWGVGFFSPDFVCEELRAGGLAQKAIDTRVSIMFFCQQVGAFLEVDSLAYLSLEGMLDCMKQSGDQYCTACWSGNYKIPIDQPQSKFSFERDQLRMF